MCKVPRPADNLLNLRLGIPNLEKDSSFDWACNSKIYFQQIINLYFPEEQYFFLN